MTTPSLRRAARWLLTFILGLLALMLLASLAACGGGDAPQPDQPPPGVDCQATPEKCR